METDIADPVIAIALDAMEPAILEEFIASGDLPFLAQLAQSGLYARHQNFAYYATENGWLTFLQGCSPEESHEWSHLIYNPGAYEVNEAASYRFNRHRPFYARMPGRTSAVFDLPLVGLVDGVEGCQALGWGTEANQILRQSAPEGLMDDLIARHGSHPLYNTYRHSDEGDPVISYRIPTIYDQEGLRALRDMLVSATDQRTDIILDLMQGGRRDLVLAAYGETHTAGHMFWHLGRGHPLAASARAAGTGDYLRDVCQAIDRGLARIADAAPQGATLMVFSTHGMRGNSLDVYSMLFLPEMLYRWSTGQAAFGNAASTALPAARTDYAEHWADEVWKLRTAHGETVLESPSAQRDRDDPLYWEPANWFRPAWRSMKAFSLPGYSEGLVRLNIAERDGANGVDPNDYEATCAQLTQMIASLRDARSGTPLAERVVRTRTDPFEEGDHLSPADLLVVWNDALFTDAVDHPDLGRIGPVPYFRVGGHATEGFVIAQGKRFSPNAPPRSDVKTTDVTATILDLLDVERPAHMRGASLAQPEFATSR